ncbi:hypothetical protein EST38_g8278 [Candolleomyces aberdarensis]|uniref:Fungal-type protein kinase domain-containing protein n=1 Tax=Candolleomyces aberdarensis TaxID=2316362 RepID=A0A4Q2DF78_9AGAR|nr:hypothetical protein EST38_g8278 [Candolleomyces aberdarensis]
MSTYSSNETSEAGTTTTQDTVEERAKLFHDLRVGELGEKIQLTDEAWARSLYLDPSATNDIEKYLADSGEYRDGRWFRIPERPSLESELQEPLCTIINSIIQHLGSPALGDVREAVNTHASPFKCATIASSKHTPSPTIVIKASGPSFSLPIGAVLGFSNSSACIAAKLDTELTGDLDQLGEMAFYAKQMFIEQPNRFFVRSLLVTEQHARLFHFDRSGGQYSPLFNLHKDAHTFIRLILGLCAAEERALGLDDTVQWTKGPDGRKTGGTLKTIGPDNTVATYELVTEEEPFTRSSVRGRGTTCWPVRNSRGDRFIVKDHWISGSRIPEFELLKEVIDLTGVCQMVSYENNRAQTKDFRGDTSAFSVSAFHNRTAIRIVMKAYGPSLENFSNAEQFLAALRDAIAGHRALLAKNIIHRDISPNNILLGACNADEGERGILIDLDIALRLNSPSDNRADFNIGTRLFQSVTVLMTYRFNKEEISPHDYLDDLEAFFWVFSYIIIVYKSNGKRAPKGPLLKGVTFWQEDASIAYSCKFGFLHSGTTTWEVEHTIDEGWRFACLDLFVQFKNYMAELAKMKEEIVYTPRDSDPSAVPNLFSSVLEPVDKHYDHILTLFDDALKKVKGSESTKSDKDSTTTLPTTPQVSTPTSITSPVSAVLPADQVSPLTLPQITSIPSSSDLSRSTLPSTPSLSSSLAQPPSPSRSPKRRFDEAELDEPDSQTDKKRSCPPSRRPLRAVWDPTLQVLNSMYEYCIKWF